MTYSVSEKSNTCNGRECFCATTITSSIALSLGAALTTVGTFFMIANASFAYDCMATWTGSACLTYLALPTGWPLALLITGFALLIIASSIVAISFLTSNPKQP